MAKSTLQSAETQPCWSARDSRGHHRAKHRALTDNLMTRFAVLEAGQQLESTDRMEAEGTSRQAACRVTGDYRSTPITVVSATPSAGRQVTSEGLCWDKSEGW